MKLAGSFQYQPSFELDESSTQELLELEEINDIVDDDPDICHSIVDYYFDDVEAIVIYGEIGSESETGKFFLRTVVDEEGKPEEVKVYVPDNQDTYPTAKEFWQGFNEPEDSESEERQMFQSVENIAKNFKTGQIVVIDAADLIEQQREEQ